MCTDIRHLFLPVERFSDPADSLPDKTVQLMPEPEAVA